MYQLVIAEKPSVAQSLAAVLGAGQRREGYLEGNGWLVSWCVGHLAELADAAAYNPAYAKWRKEDLPILPESWRFTIAKDKRDQFDVLRTLLRREDVSEVVNACDAGREGELIFRTVYALAGCSKPISRLWISSMEDEAIREGFAHLRPGREYDGLHQAALCRSKADWLVGINATRLFSLLYGCTLNIGRVVSPTLALVVQREAEIATFQPEPFYMVELDCDGLSLAGDRKASKKEAQEAAARCQGSAAVVQSVERWEKTEKPPALFDLTTLQREANRTLGYTAQQTLDYLQALYDKKLSTYPRTDSRYLTDDMEAGVPALVEAAASICGVTAPETVLAGQVCDSARVSDHHAVVPTASAGKADLEALPIGEREILRLVSLGLLRAVCPPCRSAETCITAVCGGDPYTVKWRSVLSPGWKVYAQTADAEAGSGPDGLTEGQTLPVAAAQVKSGKTTPPKHHTEDSLLSAMEMAGKEDIIDLFVDMVRHEYLLTQPLTKDDIRAEAARILSAFQAARGPNSPSGTHFMVQVSPDFLARANSKNQNRLVSMLPFRSLSISTLEGRKGVYALITKDEDRAQSLRLRKPSVRKKLSETKAEPGHTDKKKVREQER